VRDVDFKVPDDEARHSGPFSISVYAAGASIEAPLPSLKLRRTRGPHHPPPVL